MSTDTHSKAIGYALWVFGFTGTHRLCYGRPIAGTIRFFTLGLHRFHLGKWGTGLPYVMSAGPFGLGCLNDDWTLNQQIDENNRGPG